MSLLTTLTRRRAADRGALLQAQLRDRVRRDQRALSGGRGRARASFAEASHGAGVQGLLPRCDALGAGRRPRAQGRFPGAVRPGAGAFNHMGERRRFDCVARPARGRDRASSDGRNGQRALAVVSPRCRRERICHDGSRCHHRRWDAVAGRGQPRCLLGASRGGPLAHHRSAAAPLERARVSWQPGDRQQDEQHLGRFCL